MTFLSLVLLLLLAVAVAVILALLRRRPPAPVPPSPYARDDAFGRPDPAWSGGYPQQQGLPPAGGGIGGSMAGGLAAGLALGAGAVAAQEIGRRMFEQGHQPQPHAADPTPAAPHEDARHSQLARDAGIGAFEPGHDPQRLQDAGDAGWDEPGGFDDAGGDDGGGWEA